MKFSRSEQGFTILELMLATTAFSIVLVMVLGSFLQIGRMYYRGVSISKTEEASRTIVDDIGRALQFSRNSVNPIDLSGTSIGVICFGDLRYSFAPNKRLNTTSTPLAASESSRVIFRDTGASTCTEAISGASIKGSEMLEDNMRLNYIKVAEVGSTGLWRIDLSLAYGEDDVFESTGGVVDYTKCRSSTSSGTQFCGVSNVTTYINRRLN